MVHKLMAVGFETSDDSIYVLSPMGLSLHFPRLAKDGHAPIVSHCLFTRAIPPEDLCGPDDRIVPLYFHSNGKTRLPFSDHQPVGQREKYKQVFIRRQHKKDFDNHKDFLAVQHPVLGYIPVQFAFAKDDRGNWVSHDRIGTPVTRVIETVPELIGLLRHHGVRALDLPVEYMAEARACVASAGAAQLRGENGGSTAQHTTQPGF